MEPVRQSRRPKRSRRPLPPPSRSASLLVRLPPDRVGLFRFLLEARDNLGGFTVLDRREALLKVFFSPHQAAAMRRALAEIGQTVALEVLLWPIPADAPAAERQTHNRQPEADRPG